MKKTQGRKIQKKAAKAYRKVSDVTKKAKKLKSNDVAKKLTKSGLLGRAKKKLNEITKKSSKTLTKAKNRVYATEEEILDYVKANPIKSISAMALASLIAGFISTRYKK